MGFLWRSVQRFPEHSAARSLIVAWMLVITSPASVAKNVPAEAVNHVVVGGTDTLWSIAADVRRDGVSIEEAMLAIVRANPDAFTDGDPGRLRAGARLVLPWVAAPAAEEAQGNVAVPESAEVLRPDRASTEAAAAAEAAAAIERLTTENAALHTDVARGAEALKRAASERDRLLEENASLRAVADAATVAGPSRPQQMPASSGPALRPPVALPAIALLLGIVLGVGGNAAWRRWRRRGAPAARRESDASSLRGLAARVRSVAAPSRGAVPASPADAERAMPQDLDAAIDAVAGDPVAVKLEMARAFIDIGDTDSAQEVLREVTEQGDPDQRAAAAELLQHL